MQLPLLLPSLACAWLGAVFCTQAQSVIPGLVVNASATAPTSARIAQTEGRFGPGKTSLRYKTNKLFKREGSARQVGYYERDRDLGQTFTVGHEAFLLKSITVQLTDSVFAGAAGAEMLVQVFEVEGEPVVNNNGTDSGQVVHWTTEAWADDFITGETYHSRLVVGGGRLPGVVPRRSYLTFVLPDAVTFRLQPGKRYAFLILFAEPAADRAIAFANTNGKGRDSYPGGHGIRREARGTPPVPNDQVNSTFPPLAQRLAIVPTTNGFPDVDTYRDFVFFIEGR